MHVASSLSLPSQEDNGHHAYNIMHGRERRYSHGSSMVLIKRFGSPWGSVR